MCFSLFSSFSSETKDLIRCQAEAEQPKALTCVTACDWQVSLSWSHMTRAPGDKVTLRVAAAQPASLVGILVVDKATGWAESRNDITKATVRINISALKQEPVSLRGSNQ